MQVSEIMTANPACCTPDSSLQEAARMMLENDCGLIPVVENLSNKKPIGTVTDRDITVRAFTTGENPLEMKVSDVMTKGVAAVSPNANLRECADVMEDHKIRRVLVLDKNGAVCGIVAQADLAEHAPNEELVGRVVEEISEAEATPNRGLYAKLRGNKSQSQNRAQDRSRSTNQSYTPRNYKYKEKTSIFSLSSIFPLLAGIGAGAAINYYYGGTGASRSKNYSSRSLEFENKPKHDLPNRTNAASASMSSTANTVTDVSDREVIPSNSRDNAERNSKTDISLGHS
jgi:CBS domain-containing protein